MAKVIKLSFSCVLNCVYFLVSFKLLSLLSFPLCKTCKNIISVAIILLICRFTCMAVCLFQVREFLSKLDELVGKVSYDNDPIKAQKPALQRRADTLLKDLLKRSLFLGHGHIIFFIFLSFCEMH